MGYGSGNHGRLSDHKRPIGDFFEMNRERRLCEPWQGGEEGSEEFLSPARPDDGQRWPGSSLVFRKDHRIEKIGDEVGKVVGVIVGEENVGDPMPIHTGLQEIRQRARTKIQQDRMVGADEIARCCSRGMYVCAGAKNC